MLYFIQSKLRAAGAISKQCLPIHMEPTDAVQYLHLELNFMTSTSTDLLYILARREGMITN